MDAGVIKGSVVLSLSDWGANVRIVKGDARDVAGTLKTELGAAGRDASAALKAVGDAAGGSVETTRTLTTASAAAGESIKAVAAAARETAAAGVTMDVSATTAGKSATTLTAAASKQAEALAGAAKSTAWLAELQRKAAADMGGASTASSQLGDTTKAASLDVLSLGQNSKTAADNAKSLAKASDSVSDSLKKSGADARQASVEVRELANQSEQAEVKQKSLLDRALEKVESVNKTLGQRGILKNLSEIAIGSGAIGGLTFVANQLSQMAQKAEDFSVALRRGEQGTSELTEGFVKAVPIIGQAYSILGNVAEILAGIKAKAAEAASEAQRLTMTREGLNQLAESGRAFAKSMTEAAQNARDLLEQLRATEAEREGIANRQSKEAIDRSSKDALDARKKEIKDAEDSVLGPNEAALGAAREALDKARRFRGFNPNSDAQRREVAEAEANVRMQEQNVAGIRSLYSKQRADAERVTAQSVAAQKAAIDAQAYEQAVQSQKARDEEVKRQREESAKRTAEAERKAYLDHMRATGRERQAELDELRFGISDRQAAAKSKVEREAIAKEGRSAEELLNKKWAEEDARAKEDQQRQTQDATSKALENQQRVDDLHTEAKIANLRTYGREFEAQMAELEQRWKRRIDSAIGDENRLAAKEAYEAEKRELRAKQQAAADRAGGQRPGGTAPRGGVDAGVFHPGDEAGGKFDDNVDRAGEVVPGGFDAMSDRDKQRAFEASSRQFGRLRQEAARSGDRAAYERTLRQQREMSRRMRERMGNSADNATQARASANASSGADAMASRVQSGVNSTAGSLPGAIHVTATPLDEAKLGAAIAANLMPSMNQRIRQAEAASRFAAANAEVGVNL